MKNFVKILHIDPDYKITYFVNFHDSLIRFPISLKQAIRLLKTRKFDLILSEPHHKAILNPRNPLPLFTSSAKSGGRSFGD